MNDRGDVGRSADVLVGAADAVRRASSLPLDEGLAGAATALARFAPDGRLAVARRNAAGATAIVATSGFPAAVGSVLLPAGAEEEASLARGHAVRVVPGPGRDAANEACGRSGRPLVAVPIRTLHRTFGAFVIVDPGPAGATTVERLWPALAALVAEGLARAEDRRESEARAAALAEAEKLAALGTLMAGVVHELGGPLQSVISLADVLERDPDRDDRLEAARRILRSALRCKQIAQELLAFARRNPSRRMRIDPRAAILDALELDRFADVGDVEFKFEEGGGSSEVVCDPQRLAQVVLNLLTNARAAVAESGGRGVVRVSLERCDGSTTRLPEPRPAHAVRIAVEDRGPGVPPELREKIFEAFMTTKKEGRGTGLGLHVSRGMVEEAGGVLWLDTAHSPGARFVVELPAAGAAPATSGEEAAARAEPPRGLRILVVDDDRDVLETYQVVLALDRHEVTACDRGRAALEACANTDFDAIVCDVRLPDLGGAEFVEALARLRPRLAARVIFATGDVVAAETQALLSSTPQPSLQKPFRIEELEAAIRAVAPPRP
jgi:signal transduction histidine kinase/ActR/RegA family two-component response regulator